MGRKQFIRRKAGVAVSGQCHWRGGASEPGSLGSLHQVSDCLSLPPGHYPRGGFAVTFCVACTPSGPLAAPSRFCERGQGLRQVGNLTRVSALGRGGVRTWALCCWLWKEVPSLLSESFAVCSLAVLSWDMAGLSAPVALCMHSLGLGLTSSVHQGPRAGLTALGHPPLDLVLPPLRALSATAVQPPGLWAGAKRGGVHAKEGAGCPGRAEAARR